MAKFISRVNPVSFKALKRKPHGTVVVHHWNTGEARFTRVEGGWLYECEWSADSVWMHPAEVISSVDVARECNASMGCKESWARIY